jgi:hypothetical protein
MNTSNATLSIFEIIDFYLNKIIIGVHSLSFLTEIFLLILYSITLIFYCFKKNFHISFIMSTLSIQSFFQLFYHLISLVFYISYLFYDYGATGIGWVVTANAFAFVSVMIIFCLFLFLAYLYSKTAKDINSINNCCFVTTKITFIGILIVLILTTIFIIIISVVLAVIVFCLGPKYDFSLLSMFYGLATVPSLIVMIVEVGVVSCAVNFFSCFITTFICRLSKKINDRKVKFRNYFNLFKIVFLVFFVNFTFYSLGFIVVTEVGFVVFKNIFWFLCSCSYIYIRLQITILFYVSFSPSFF